MVPRIKTLPFASVAARPYRRAVEGPAPVIVMGAGALADRAREAAASLELAPDTHAPLVLVSGTVLDHLVEVDASAPPPRFWTIAGPGDVPAAGGVDGVALHPVTPALIEALRFADAEVAVGTGAGAPDPRTLLAISLLDDVERFGEEIAAAFGADECRTWIKEGVDLRAMARADVGVPPAARIAADCRTRVAVDHQGDVSTWIAVWCVRSAGEEPSGLLALRFDGVAAAGVAVEELDRIATRTAIELSWLRVHRRMVAEQERLRAAAMIEPLTGAWTRAAFERTVEVELAAARRRGEYLSLAIFDIDGLKRINDTHGHDAGDAVLAHVAANLRANLRINDVLGRFGDDELGVLLIGADLARAHPVIERLVRRLNTTPFEHDGKVVPFTVRAGLTQVGFDKTGETVFARAVRAIEDARDAPTSVASSLEEASVATVLDADAQVGTMVGATLPGGYRILHEINRGANGVVYRGEDLGLGRPVAIKLLRADLGHDTKLVAKFRREASILASLRHHNLVEVYAFGAAEQVFFVMELVEGPTVADVVDDALDRGEWLDAAAVAELIDEIADALDAMHAAGLVHCDVKPENIVLDRNAQRAVLVDIGECKRHDEDRHRAGTPGYAAPESFGQAEETAAIDTYALGATAYMMLTARLPFGFGDALSILARQLDAPPTAPSQIRVGLPAAVDAVILKALAVDPADRFGSPGAFAAALRRAVRGTTQSGEIPAVVLEPNDRAGYLRELTVGSIPLAVASVRPMVRGAAFRVAAKMLGARVGEPWLSRIAAARRDLGEVLQPTVPPMSWQPIDLLFELVAQLDDVDHAELLRTIGRGTVSVTFGHVYGADPSAATTHALLTSVPRLWSRYFDFGAIEVAATSEGCVILRADGGDAAVAALVAGFLERIAELTGAVGVSVAVVTDDASTSYVVEWEDSHVAE